MMWTYYLYIYIVLTSAKRRLEALLTFISFFFYDKSQNKCHYITTTIYLLCIHEYDDNVPNPS